MIVPTSSTRRAAGVLLAAAMVAWAASPATAEQACEGWENVSDALLAGLDDYEGKTPGARGIGGIAVDRHSGDLIAVLNGPPWGIYRSGDAGKSWARMDSNKSPVAGGWIRSFSIRIDQDRPGRIAVFRVSPPAPVGPRGRGYKSRSAMTLDGGKTWKSFGYGPNDGLFGLGGWTHGMVDWSGEEPNRIVAQNRVRPQLCLSVDGGESFKPLYRPGIIEESWNHQYVKAENHKDWQSYAEDTLTGYGISAAGVLRARRSGIEISIDDGKTWETVSELVPMAHTPVRFDGKLYWGAERGVIVSADEGRTWTPIGSDRPMIRKGPMFGEDANAFVVVAEDGVYRTEDGGETWKRLADLYRDPAAWRSEDAEAWRRHDYAWDHRRDLLYVSGMAGACYKEEVK